MLSYILHMRVISFIQGAKGRNISPTSCNLDGSFLMKGTMLAKLIQFSPLSIGISQGFGYEPNCEQEFSLSCLLPSRQSSCKLMSWVHTCPQL